MCDAEGENLLELGTATLSKAEEGFIDCHSVTRNYVFQGKYATGIEDIHVISDEGESGKQGILTCKVANSMLSLPTASISRMVRSM